MRRTAPQGVGQAPAEGGSVNPPAFFDSWEDGNYTQDPPWTEYIVEGDGFGQVIDQAGIPTGDQKVLQVHESTGGGTRYVIGWQDGIAGWDTEWRFQGLFYTEDVFLGDDFQNHRVYAYYDSGDTAPLEVRLGFRAGDGSNRPLSIQGSLINTVDTTDDMDGWAVDTWYWYELLHTGGGNYEAFCWEDDTGKPTSPNATSTGVAPGGEARKGAIFMNGGQEPSFTMNHDFMQWQV